MARRREQDHCDVTQPFIAPHRGRDGGPIHLGHHQVDDRDLERILAGHCAAHLAQPLAGRFEALPAHAPRVHVALEDRAVRFVVVDDRDLRTREATARTRRAGPRGRLAEK